jgi:hypothetical protein
MRRHFWGFALLFLGCFGTPAAADPVTLSHGVWTVFSWGDLGPIDFPADGYVLTSPTRSRVRITDCCVTGDAFDVFSNGVHVLATPLVEPGHVGHSFEPDATWADPIMSKGVFLLPPWTHHITISLRALVAPVSGGIGYLRADPAPVPEPATLTLLGSGLLAVGWKASRRRLASRISARRV